jgi:hypothetical protein
MLQAGIRDVHYLHPWDPIEAYGDPALAAQYSSLRARFESFAQIGDPDKDSPDAFAALLAD